MSRETLPPRPEGEEIFWTSSPNAPGDAFCCSADLTSWPSCMAYVCCDDATRFAKLSKRSGCTVSTMVLSEALGLWLYRVIRGGIGLSQRLGAEGTMPTGNSHTHPRTRASHGTGWPSWQRSARGRGSSTETLKLLAVLVCQRRSFLPSSKVSA